jgi:dolichyl-diphosphooligosaccharide--protein glycosyltransferase
MKRHWPGLDMVVLVGCAVVAFLLRASIYRDFITPSGGLLFLDPDSYDHLRRVTLGVASFPRIPAFDPYYGFPVGSGQIWSPLFDYLISAFVTLCGGRHYPALAETVGFWLSPVLAAATIFLVYCLGRQLLGRTAALTAALVVAILPAHVMYSFAAQLDHHVAEPLVCMLLMGSFLKPADRRFGWLATGFWLVFSLLIWRGAVIFWGVAVLALLLQGRDEVKRQGNSPTAAFGARACLGGALILSPLCLLDLWGSSATIAFETVSWFHVLLLLASAAALAIAGSSGSIPRRWPLAAGGLLAAVLLLAASPHQLGHFLTEFRAGLAVIFSRDPWLDSISELHSVFFPEGVFDWHYGARFLSGLYLLAPVVSLLVWRSWRQSREGDLRLPLFLVWNSFFFILPLFRERYMHLAAITTALGAGFLVARYRERLPVKPAWRSVVVVGALLLFLSPIIPFLVDPGGEVRLDAEEKYGLRDTLAWLRDRTPPTSGFSDPRRKPEYGVLAHWGIGSYVTYLGQRPTLATNFGWETHGLYESCAFLTTINPAVAEEIIHANRIRYIVLGNHSADLRGLWAIAEQGVAKRKLPFALMTPFNPPMSMFYRLYFDNGATVDLPANHEDALERYRLVHVSPGGQEIPRHGFVPWYKIFEHVPGVLLKGRARPGTVVSIDLELRNDRGLGFDYRDVVRARSDGTFAFHLPYATDGRSGDFTPQGVYNLDLGGERRPIRISAADVLTGNTVLLVDLSGR